MRLRMMLILGGMAFTASCAVVPVYAEFGVSVSGQAEIIDPPASAVAGATESNNYQVWFEGCQTLEANLHVDYVPHHRDDGDDRLGNLLDNVLSIVENDTFAFGSDDHKIHEGTCVCSYFVHLDPAQIENRLFINPQATLTFDQQILGIAFRDHRLDQSDYLGAPGTTYPTGANFRGLGFFDTFTVSGGGHVLDLSFFARYGFDQIRVFTACEQGSAPVPEPASLVVWSLVALTGGSLTWRRRKRCGLAEGAPNSPEKMDA